MILFEDFLLFVIRMYNNSSFIMLDSVVIQKLPHEFVLSSNPTVCLPRCGHGGHMSHLKAWFLKHKECPTGCGCQCVILPFASKIASSDDSPFSANEIVLMTDRFA
jgi:Zinc-ribbon, C4HC2 type